MRPLSGQHPTRRPEKRNGFMGSLTTAIVGLADVFDIWTRRLIVVLMAAITVTVIANVFFRYVINFSIIWSEEFSVYSLIWASFLGAAVAFREKAHVAFTVVISAFGKNNRHRITILNNIVVIVFLGIMTYFGADLAISNWAQQTPALRISKGIPYMAIPVSGVLMMLQVARIILLQIRSGPGDDDEIQHHPGETPAL
jgi:TRAP-type C4-dicarboxylate transport system permease small subunit